MIKLFISILNFILFSPSPKAVRLEKVEKSSFEKTCDRLVPYVLFIALVTLGILLLVILVKYGHSITGTESNAYYYHME
jgi:hypothetical protein